MKMRYSIHPVKTFFRVSFLVAEAAIRLDLSRATNTRLSHLVRQDIFSSFFSRRQGETNFSSTGDEH